MARWWKWVYWRMIGAVLLLNENIYTKKPWGFVQFYQFFAYNWKTSSMTPYKKYTIRMHAVPRTSTRTLIRFWSLEKKL